jgi:hypothetical protein
MAVAGAMIAHQVASKAVRDATFLGAWPATALPAIVIATAGFVVLAVPVYAKLLARFGPQIVVPAGFLVSAAGHAVEWQVPPGPWLAVAIYLHVAGFGALLLSGFWSVASELFDPQSARWGYGRIAAAGTIGGLTGGLVTAKIAAMTGQRMLSPLLLLALLHVLCAAGLLVMGRFARPQPEPAEPNPGASGVFTFRSLRRTPHLKTLALLIVLSTAGAAIADYLLKSEAAQPGRYPTDADLLRFFAMFYTVIQVATVLLQTFVGTAVRRLGLGKTIAALPGGLGLTSGLALLYPIFPMFAIERGVESVLRGSLFRSGYELIFVPMDPEEKRRTKTFLDVTCDRAGDALGAAIVWLVLFTTLQFQKGEMLAITMALAGGALYLARRLDVLYVGVVARRLVKHGEPTPIVMGSEAGWTVLNLPVRSGTQATVAPPPRTVAPALVMSRTEDARLRTLAEMRSGDRRRVEAALQRVSQPDALQIAQVIQLLAWDDVVLSARRVLEANAKSHIGQMNDALVDEQTDFAIRRRLPRILGTLSSERALFGLMRGLEDTRFEVRYQCARAIDRMIVRGEGLRVDRDRIMAAVERELSVSPQVWHGHHLIDRVDREEGEERAAAEGTRARRNLEHVFTLLSTMFPREPVQVAFRGIQSDDPGLRALAAEYINGVLPPAIRARLWTLLEADTQEAHEDLRKQV